MKKIIIAAAVILTVSFAACTKDSSVNPTSAKTTKLADDSNKQDIGQADGNKQDIGQADGN